MAPSRVADCDAVMEYRRGESLISTDRERLDLDVVHDFLTNCYWAKGIPREVVARSIEHSLCFGIYDGECAQGNAAGRGVGKWLMECISQHPALQDLRRWILTTRDAHGLYSQVGFTPVRAPERFMERHRPDVYETPGKTI